MQDTDHNTGDTFESKGDVGGSPDKTAKRWLTEIELAERIEKDWRTSARECVEIYRGDKEPYFNILHSNTQTLLPAIFNQVPSPDIRRRFKSSMKDKDKEQPQQMPAGPQGGPQGMMAPQMPQPTPEPSPEKIERELAEGLERAVSFSCDQYDFVDEVQASLLDYLVTGRGQLRVRYDGLDDEEGTAYEEVTVELVPWDDFLLSPARTWAGVRWVAFRHKMTRDEVSDQFGPGAASVLKYNYSAKSDDRDSDTLSKEEEDKSPFKRAEVWEIWDKDERQVVWLSKDYKESPIAVMDDPLSLEGFFPCPKPIYSIRTPDGMVPVPEYRIYERQAKELNSITERIAKITDALKVRGIYDAQVAELAQVFSAAENELIPSDNVLSALSAAQTKDLDGSIWMVPVDRFAQVLQQLYPHREMIKQTIYEITGLSDILRGQTNPNETLGAQQIKAQFGSLRIDDRRREVARFVRDVIRLKAEIIAEHWDPGFIAMVIGADPETVARHLPLLRDDLSRGIKVDIETDSTVSLELQEDKEAMTELLSGIVQFLQGIAPVVEPNGPVPLDTAKQMLLAIIRRHKMGRTVEDAIENIGGENQAGAQNQQMMQMQQQQQEMMQQMQQMEQMKMQAEMQASQAKLAETQAKAQVVQVQHQARLMELQADLKVTQMQNQLEEAGLQRDLKRHEQEHDFTMNELERKEDVEKQKHELEMEALKAKLLVERAGVESKAKVLDINEAAAAKKAEREERAAAQKAKQDKETKDGG